MTIPYDPGLRRPTPLQRHLTERLATKGPLSVRDYMQCCLQHPEYGYYRTQSAIGAGGDFITAPEISQIFGELLGLWAVAAWQQMGCPTSVRLVELGAGRGTLLDDAMRAARIVPAFTEALSVSIVESNPLLATAQKKTLAAHPGLDISWHARLDIPRDRPTILIANEYLDCIPIEQWILSGSTARTPQVCQRLVTLSSNGGLAFTAGRGLPPDAMSQHLKHALARLGPEHLTDNAIIETYADGEPMLADLLGFVASDATSPPLAGLLIDYGHHGAASAGDTLQAIRNQSYEHPLTSPGEADLTAHVDFAEIARLIEGLGVATDGPQPQAVFLGRLGAAERAAVLSAKNPHLAGDIEAALARLMSPAGMGSRFLALGLRSPGLPVLPGLA